MKQIHSFDELRQIKDTKVYALGTFDGIHRGHQRVIRKAVEEATSVNGVSIIITFEHHPLTILHPDRVPKRVIQEEIMDTVLEELKVDYILRLPMTEALLKMIAICGASVGFSTTRQFFFGSGLGSSTFGSSFGGS